LFIHTYLADLCINADDVDLCGWCRLLNYAPGSGTWNESVTACAGETSGNRQYSLLSGKFWEKFAGTSVIDNYCGPGCESCSVRIIRMYNILLYRHSMRKILLYIFRQL